MNEVSRLLSDLEQGDPHAAEGLLPLIYDELRKLAARKIAQEAPGQTLQATALVHEAYLRLVVSGKASAPEDRHWDSRGHFFAAAAEAMRRILVERARSKRSRKQGGERERQALELDDLPVKDPGDPREVMAIHEALDRLAEKSPRKAELVKLRYFLGCTMAEAAQILGIAVKTAEEDWTYARAWLRRQWLHDEEKKAAE
jgi:RNA polymerase sigma factor (TIGR02999 family)